MMNGATMPRASTARTSARADDDRGQPRPRRGLRGALYPRLDLGEAAGDLRSPRPSSAEIPTSAAACADLARAPRRRPPRRRRLARARRRTARRRGRRRARAARARAALAPIAARTSGREREQLERRGQRRHLVVVGRHLERDVVRQLGEPADVADDERLAERERRGSTLPDVSPIVGCRRFTSTSLPAMSAQSLVSSTQPSRTSASSVEPDALEPAGRGRSPATSAPTSRRRAGRDALCRTRRRSPRAAPGSACSSCTTPKQPTTVPVATRSGSSGRSRPRRMRYDADRPVVAGRARVIADVARVDDERRRVLEHERRASGKSAGP